MFKNYKTVKKTLFSKGFSLAQKLIDKKIGLTHFCQFLDTPTQKIKSIF